MTSVPLAGGAEFDRIRAIARTLGPRARGLGGDCALVEFRGETLALSTDVSVEGVHFRRDWLTSEEIGWRAGAAALSDLAAVGAEAIGLLAAITLPRELPEGDTTALMAGLGAAAMSVGGVVLGGDLSRGDAISLAVTVVGRVSRPVPRSGAKPGDVVCVTGALGGARAALAAWEAGRAPDQAARAAFARPEPRLTVGRWLALHGATAMIDLSDGLAGDAAHLAAASGAALEIRLDRLPLHPSVPADGAGEPAAVFAARGGEDYELLVTLPAKTAAGAPDRCRADTGVELTRIGVVRDGTGVQFLLGGRPVELRGYDHFA